MLRQSYAGAADYNIAAQRVNEIDADIGRLDYLFFHNGWHHLSVTSSHDYQSIRKQAHFVLDNALSFLILSLVMGEMFLIADPSLPYNALHYLLISTCCFQLQLQR